MIKYLFIPICFIAPLFGGYVTNAEPVTGASGQSKMHQMQQKHPDALPDDQRHVANMLSPLYQRIYIYSLDDSQREAVAVFERRGENPYTAIDNILKRDRARSDPAVNMDKSPRGRSQNGSAQKGYVISQKESAEQSSYEQDSDDQEYEMYTSGATVYSKSSDTEKESSSPKTVKGSCSPCNETKQVEKVKEPKVKKAACVKKTSGPNCSKKAAWGVRCNQEKKQVKKEPVKASKKAPSKSNCCDRKLQDKYKYVEDYRRCKCNSCKK